VSGYRVYVMVIELSVLFWVGTVVTALGIVSRYRG